MGAFASVALTLGVSDAIAQAPQHPDLPANFKEGTFYTGTASTYRTPSAPVTNGTVTGGTVRIRHKEGKIDGKYGSGPEEGKRMPGIVIYYCESKIPGGTFFTDLGTEGNGGSEIGNKDPNGQNPDSQVIDISGNYDPQGNGPRKYADGSTIKFSGNDSNKPQTIPDEGPNNGGGFDIVDLVGDAPKQTKTCATDSETHIKQLKQSGGLFTNKGTLVLANRTDSPHTIDAMVNDAGGNGDCGITLKDGGTMDIATSYTNTSGYWKLESTSNVNMAGEFTYTAGDMKFACNSNFHYMGNTNQTIVKTESAVKDNGFYAYGNLLLSKSDKKTAAGHIKICNDLKTASDFDLFTNNGSATILNEADDQVNHVFFTVDGTPETDKEIMGLLKYNKVKPGAMLTYNNKDTKVKFESATDLTFGLNVRPGVQPDMLKDFSAATDVKRKINVQYSGTGKISHLEASWKEADEDGFTAPTEGSPIRFAEGYNSNQDRKKLIRVGATYDNDNANRIVRYGRSDAADGINLVGTDGPAAPEANLVDFNRKLFNGSDIVLSTKTQKVVSITNGRWSNPATWETGIEPYGTDDVEIRHTVWVGSIGGHFGGDRYEGDERAITSVSQGKTDGTQYAARSITIEDVENAGLYILTDDGTLGRVNGTDIVFQTQMEGEAGKVGIYNYNTRTHPADQGTTGNGMNGLFLSAVTNNYIPVLGAAMYDNRGTFTNLGVTEVGLCK